MRRFFLQSIISASNTHTTLITRRIEPLSVCLTLTHLRQNEYKYVISTLVQTNREIEQSIDEIFNSLLTYITPKI